MPARTWPDITRQGRPAPDSHRRPRASADGLRRSADDSGKRITGDRLAVVLRRKCARVGQTARSDCTSVVDAGHLRPPQGPGAFFAPEPVARFVTDWALRTCGDHVLEPSCGEAAFLLSADAACCTVDGH